MRLSPIPPKHTRTYTLYIYGHILCQIFNMGENVTFTPVRRCRGCQAQIAIASNVAIKWYLHLFIRTASLAIGYKLYRSEVDGAQGNPENPFQTPPQPTLSSAPLDFNPIFSQTLWEPPLAPPSFIGINSGATTAIKCLHIVCVIYTNSAAKLSWSSEQLWA